MEPISSLLLQPGVIESVGFKQRAASNTRPTRC